MMEISYFFTMHQQVFWLQPNVSKGPLGTLLLENHALGTFGLGSTTLARQKRKFSSLRARILMMEISYFFTMHQQVFWLQPYGSKGPLGTLLLENHALGTFGLGSTTLARQKRKFSSLRARILILMMEISYFFTMHQQVFWLQPNGSKGPLGTLLLENHALGTFGLGSTTLARQKRKFSSLRARILMMEISYFFTMHQQVFWLQPYGPRDHWGPSSLKIMLLVPSDSGPPLWRAKRGNFPAFAHGFWWWKFLIFLPCTSKCFDFNHMGPRDHWGPSDLKIMLLVPSDSGPPLWRAKRGNFPAFAHGFWWWKFLIFLPCTSKCFDFNHMGPRDHWGPSYLKIMLLVPSDSGPPLWRAKRGNFPAFAHGFWWWKFLIFLPCTSKCFDFNHMGPRDHWGPSSWKSCSWYLRTRVHHFGAPKEEIFQPSRTDFDDGNFLFFYHAPASVLTSTIWVQGTIGDPLTWKSCSWYHSDSGPPLWRAKRGNFPAFAHGFWWWKFLIFYHAPASVLTSTIWVQGTIGDPLTWKSCSWYLRTRVHHFGAPKEEIFQPSRTDFDDGNFLFFYHAPSSVLTSTIWVQGTIGDPLTWKSCSWYLRTRVHHFGAPKEEIFQPSRTDFDDGNFLFFYHAPASVLTSTIWVQGTIGDPLTWKSCSWYLRTRVHHFGAPKEEIFQPSRTDFDDGNFLFFYHAPASVLTSTIWVQGTIGDPLLENHALGTIRTRVHHFGAPKEEIFQPSRTDFDDGNFLFFYHAPASVLTSTIWVQGTIGDPLLWKSCSWYHSDSGPPLWRAKRGNFPAFAHGFWWWKFLIFLPCTSKCFDFNHMGPRDHWGPSDLKIMLLVPFGLGSTTLARQKRKFSSLRARILMMEISYFFTMHHQVFWLQPYGFQGTIGDPLTWKSCSWYLRTRVHHFGAPKEEIFQPSRTDFDDGNFLFFYHAPASVLTSTIWVQGTIGDPLTWKSCSWYHSDSGPPLWRAKRGNFPAFAHGFWWWKFLIFLPCTSKCFDFNHMGPRDHWGPSSLKIMLLVPSDSGPPLWRAKRGNFPAFAHGFWWWKFLIFLPCTSKCYDFNHMVQGTIGDPLTLKIMLLVPFGLGSTTLARQKRKFSSLRARILMMEISYFFTMHQQVLWLQPYGSKGPLGTLLLENHALGTFGLGSTTLARQKRKFSSLRARILMMEISYFFTMHQQVFWLQPYGSKGPLGTLLLENHALGTLDSGPPLWRAKRGNFPAFAHGFWWWKFLIFLPCTSKCFDFNHMGPRDHWGPSYLKIMLLVPSDSGPPLWRAKRGNFPAFAHGFWWWKFLIFLPCTSKCFDFNHMVQGTIGDPLTWKSCSWYLRTRVHHFGAPKEEIFQPSRTDFDDGNFLFFYHAPASVLTSTIWVQGTIGDPLTWKSCSWYLQTRVHHFGAPKEEIFQPSRTDFDFDDGNFLFFYHAPASVLTSTIWSKGPLGTLLLENHALGTFGLGSTTLARQKRKFSSLRARILMMEISYFFTMHQQVFDFNHMGPRDHWGPSYLKIMLLVPSDSGPPLWRAKRGNFPAFAHGFWWWKFLIFLPCTSKCFDFNHMGPRDHWGPSYLKIMLLVPSDSGPPLWRAKRGNFPAFAHGFWWWKFLIFLPCTSKCFDFNHMGPRDHWGPSYLKIMLLVPSDSGPPLWRAKRGNFPAFAHGFWWWKFLIFLPCTSKCFDFNHMGPRDHWGPSYLKIMLLVPSDSGPPLWRAKRGNFPAFAHGFWWWKFLIFLPCTSKCFDFNHMDPRDHRGPSYFENHALGTIRTRVHHFGAPKEEIFQPSRTDFDDLNFLAHGFWWWKFLIFLPCTSKCFDFNHMGPRDHRGPSYFENDALGTIRTRVHHFGAPKEEIFQPSRTDFDDGNFLFFYHAPASVLTSTIWVQGTIRDPLTLKIMLLVPFGLGSTTLARQKRKFSSLRARILMMEISYFFTMHQQVFWLQPYGSKGP